MLRLGPTKVGSDEWLANEQRLVLDMVVDEVEDFAFAARRELEWLHEHMLDISKGMSVATLLQSPKKLQQLQIQNQLPNGGSPVKMKMGHDLEGNQENVAPHENHDKLGTHAKVKFAASPAKTLHRSPVKDTLVLEKSLEKSPVKGPPMKHHLKKSPAKSSPAKSYDSQDNSSFMAIKKSIRTPGPLESKPQTKTETYVTKHSSPEKPVETASRTPKPEKPDELEEDSNSPAGFVSLPARAPLSKKSSSKSIASLSDKSYVSAQQLSPKEAASSTSTNADTSSPFQEIVSKHFVSEPITSPPKKPIVSAEPSSFMENLIKKASRLLSGSEQTATEANSRTKPVTTTTTTNTTTNTSTTGGSPSKRDVLSRLMAPTFSSASRTTTNTPGPTVTYNTGSPRPVRKPINSPVKQTSSSLAKSPAKKIPDPSLLKISPHKASPHKPSPHKPAVSTSTPVRVASPTRIPVSNNKTEPRVGSKLTSQSLQPRKPKVQQTFQSLSKAIPTTKEEPAMTSGIPSVKHTTSTSTASSVSSSTTSSTSTVPRVGPGRPLVKTSLPRPSKSDEKLPVSVNTTTTSTSSTSNNATKPMIQRSLKPATTTNKPIKRPSDPETPRQHVTKQPKLTNSQGYSNLTKATLLGNAKAAGSVIPHVDGVKFSNDKLKFAKPGSGASASKSSGPQTPVQNTQNKSLKVKINMNIARQQLQHQNQNHYASVSASAQDISLPEIMSESEDDEDGSILQDWANSPELRDILAKQQLINPDTIFGPIQPLNMEEVFTQSKRLSKLRPRSSSANWNGTDRLTQQEIEEYAREMGYNQ